jgi:membrane protein involved in colicin uptake
MPQASFAKYKAFGCVVSRSNYSKFLWRIKMATSKTKKPAAKKAVAKKKPAAKKAVAKKKPAAKKAVAKKKPAAKKTAAKKPAAKSAGKGILGA